MVRAKFQVNSVKQIVGGSGKVESIEVAMNPVYGKAGEANAQWSKYTPSGSLTMTITNEQVFDTFRPGMQFYLDLTEASD